MDTRTTQISDNIKFCMDIDTDSIDTKLITQLINLHKNIVTNRFSVLDNYYRGKQLILSRQIDDTDKPNNKPVSNFCSYTADTLAGFFMGKNVTYSSKTGDPDYLNNLLTILNDNEEANENMALASKSGIKGTSFELVYNDENALTCFNALDTDSIFIVVDTTIKNVPKMAIRYYTIQDYVNSDNNTTYVEVYTDSKIYKYIMDGDSLKSNGEEDHYFGEVPVIEFPNNRYRSSDFEQIISLQDIYNKTFADTSNDLEYYSLCYLILENMTGTQEEDIKKLNQNRVLLTPENSKAYFLEKDIKDTAIQNHIKNIKEDIHKVTYVPDLSQDLPSNLSGTAIKQKFFNTEQIIAVKERMFKKALLKRVRLITNMLNKQGHNYDWHDIDIKFNRNLPINYVELADSAIKLAGIYPKTSLIDMTAPQMGLNADKVKAELNAEDNKSLDLDKVPSSFANVNNTGVVENEQQDR